MKHIFDRKQRENEQLVWDLDSFYEKNAAPKLMCDCDYTMKEYFTYLYGYFFKCNSE